MPRILLITAHNTLRHWFAHINDLNTALDLMRQAMDKFTGTAIIDTDSAVNTPHNYAIEVLSCKSDLNRHINSNWGLIMSKSLHRTEGVQVNAV
jgi:hypothetical protein